MMKNRAEFGIEKENGGDQVYSKLSPTFSENVEKGEEIPTTAREKGYICSSLLKKKVENLIWKSAGGN